MIIFSLCRKAGIATFLIMFFAGLLSGQEIVRPEPLGRQLTWSEDSIMRKRIEWRRTTCIGCRPTVEISQPFTISKEKIKKRAEYLDMLLETGEITRTPPVKFDDFILFVFDVFPEHTVNFGYDKTTNYSGTLRYEVGLPPTVAPVAMDFTIDKDGALIIRQSFTHFIGIYNGSPRTSYTMTVVHIAEEIYFAVLGR